jgi:lysophospholipase L1-like esterase
MRRADFFVILFWAAFLSSCLSNSPEGHDEASSALKTPVDGPITFHVETTALGAEVFDTRATTITIEVRNTTPDAFGAVGEISVEDGSEITTYQMQPGESTIVHPLPAGEKRVTITAGEQARFRGEMRGVFIQEITFNGHAVPIPPSAPRILVYGDSLAVGGNVDHPSAEAWPVLLRQYYSVRVEAYGYRTLHDDASTPEKRSEFTARISDWSPETIWLAVGTNDYGLEVWSAPEFGKAYAATLDAIHSSNPGARLFAQSPIWRAEEPANSFGDDLDDYRQQIAGTCAARSAWCVYVDGRDPSFPQPEELDEDGIHLTTESSLKYAQTVLRRLGK